MNFAALGSMRRTMNVKSPEAEPGAPDTDRVPLKRPLPCRAPE